MGRSLQFATTFRVLDAASISVHSISRPSKDIFLPFEMDSEIAHSNYSQDLAHVTHLNAFAADPDHIMDRTEQEPASHTGCELDELTRAMEALGCGSQSFLTQQVNYSETYKVRLRISELLVDFLKHFTPDEQVKFLLSIACGPSSTVQSEFLVSLTPGQQARFLSLNETDRKMLLTPPMDEGYKHQVIWDFVSQGVTKGLAGEW